MTLEDKIEKKLSEGSDIQELDFRKILADIERRTILDISRMDGKFPYYGRGKDYREALEIDSDPNLNLLYEKASFPSLCHQIGKGVTILESEFHLETK